MRYLLLIGLWAATTLWVHGRFLDERAEHAKTREHYARQVVDAERSRANEEAKRRKAEQELRDAQEEHAQEIQALHLDLDRARAAGRVASERLRDAASDVAQRASQVCADSTSSELRQAASDAILVLAELRDRADERAGELARFSTDAHLAGLACERRYQEAYEKLKGLQ